eukprot:TRINITY_DN12487_c0_g1_i2.p1 TRINITY_DN12487_c0_g1~~TRINITY_DN12487_c0_g1_i2.p1  ORF type:complete len:697 (+),score=130.54 TRINITY_DN12487_c0_g1_i2:216-2093(+)
MSEELLEKLFREVEHLRQASEKRDKNIEELQRDTQRLQRQLEQALNNQRVRSSGSARVSPAGPVAQGRSESNEKITQLLPDKPPSQQPTNLTADAAFKLTNKSGRMMMGPTVIKFLQAYDADDEVASALVSDGPTAGPNSPAAASANAIEQDPFRTGVQALCDAAQCLRRGSDDPPFVAKLHELRSLYGDGSSDHIDDVNQERSISGAICPELQELLDVKMTHGLCVGQHTAHVDGVGLYHNQPGKTAYTGRAYVLLECKRKSTLSSETHHRKTQAQCANEYHRVMNTFEAAPTIFLLMTDEEHIMVYAVVQSNRACSKDFLELYGQNSDASLTAAETERVGLCGYLAHAAWSDVKAVYRLLKALRSSLDDVKQRETVHTAARPVLPGEVQEHFVAVLEDCNPRANLSARLLRTHGSCVSVWSSSTDKKPILVVKVYDNSASGRSIVQDDLLAALKEQNDFYTGWRVHHITKHIQMLSYPFLRRTNWRLADWIDTLELYRTVFVGHNWVHGDILFRNLLPGVLLDLDFSGRAGEAVYPEGYNTDTQLHRHPDAEAGAPILHEHDIYSFGWVLREEWATERFEFRRLGRNLAEACTAPGRRPDAAKKALDHLLDCLATLKEDGITL